VKLLLTLCLQEEKEERRIIHLDLDHINLTPPLEKLPHILWDLVKGKVYMIPLLIQALEATCIDRKVLEMDGNLERIKEVEILKEEVLDQGHIIMELL
jgi:hypothetical protein